MAKIKIMHLMAGGGVGGAETMFLEGVCALSQSSQVEQYVITRHEPHRVKRLAEHNIPFKTASFNNIIRFPTQHIIRKKIKKFQPDIIQYWMGRAGSYAVQGAHKNIAWYGSYYNRKKYFPLCPYHIVVTRDLKKFLVDGGVNEKNVEVIHTFAELNLDAKPIDRVDFDTPNDAPLLLALARIHWQKSIDTLLYAVKDIPQAYLWIAGDGPLMTEMVALSQKLGLENRVKFLGWRNDRDRLLQTCDIVAFPTREDAFGNVMVEAWMTKKPVVTTKAKGPKAYIKHTENGMITDIDDVDALRQSLQAVIDDQKLRQKLITNGWQDYQNYFTKEVFVRDSLDFYQKVLQDD